MDTTEIFFKFLNENLTHHNLTYKVGENTLKKGEVFNSLENFTRNGMCFFDVDNIFCVIAVL